MNAPNQHSELPVVTPGTIAEAKATLREFACPNWPHPGITGCEYCARAEERGVFEALDKIQREVEFQIRLRRGLQEQLQSVQDERDIMEQNIETAARENQRLEEQYQSAREEITRMHGTLWLLGLDDHEGEQQTTLDVALDNLRELWRQKESNPASEPERT